MFNDYDRYWGSYEFKLSLIAMVIGAVILGIGLALAIPALNPALWIYGSLPSAIVLERVAVVGLFASILGGYIFAYGLPAMFLLIVEGVKLLGRGIVAAFEGIGYLLGAAWNGLTSLFRREPRFEPPQPRPHIEFGFHDGGRLQMEFDHGDDLRLGIEGGARLYAELLMLEALIHDPIMRMREVEDRFDPMEGYRHNFYAPVAMHARPERPAAQIVDKTMKAIASDISEARARGDSEIDVSDRLQGPISYERMKDPVLAEDGFTYEREAIVKWLAQSNKSPMTREVMGRNLQPNAKMKALLDRFEGEEEAKLAVEQAGVALGV